MQGTSFFHAFTPLPLSLFYKYACDEFGKIAMLVFFPAVEDDSDNSEEERLRNYIEDEKLRYY